MATLRVAGLTDFAIGSASLGDGAAPTARKSTDATQGNAFIGTFLLRDANASPENRRWRRRSFASTAAAADGHRRIHSSRRWPPHCVAGRPPSHVPPEASPSKQTVWE